MELIKPAFGPKPPTDLAEQFRKMADAMDRGEITSAVAAYIGQTEYSFVHGGSLRDCLELSTLLQHRCVEKYKT